MKTLELHGNGYKASINGNVLSLSLGKSHEDEYIIPDSVKVLIPEPKVIVVHGTPQDSGQVAADIKRFREPNHYTGQGIRYYGETIRMKTVKK